MGNKKSMQSSGQSGKLKKYKSLMEAVIENENANKDKFFQLKNLKFRHGAKGQNKSNSPDLVKDFMRTTEDGKPMMRVVTYNIWFEHIHQQGRMESLIKVIEEQDPDFLCLQEVTNESRKILLENPWIQSTYLQDGGGSANEFVQAHYGCMIFSKYPCYFFEKNFDSLMGRSLLVAEPCLPEPLLLATAHFESLDSERHRKEQMEITFDLLKRAQGSENKCSIVVGDFNFDSSWQHEEAVIISNGWKDIMHDFVDSKEWTMPKNKRFPAWRPDKVVTQEYDQCKQHWHCINAQIIGKRPTSFFAELEHDIMEIEKDNIVRTPSDHMGIVVDFELRKPIAQE